MDKAPPGAPERKKRPRVEIQIPEQYVAMDEGVWEDLEVYLYQGFLTSSAHLVNKTFVFKTLNHSELRLIRMTRPLAVSAPEAQDLFRAQFIAYSIFMIDGENTLPDRHRHINRLVRTISKIERSSQVKIVENLAALNEKATRLHPLTEVYIHENRSRFRWMHVQQAPVHSPVNTGIYGTEELGMNYCQQAWTALNRLVDYKEDMEREWSNAKFIGSCFAGKGVRPIDERDRARKEREKTELQELKMEVLKGYLNRVSGKVRGIEKQIQLPDGRMAVVEKEFRAKDVAELRDQLSAALSGEKDHHDLVVDAHMAKLKDRASQIDHAKSLIHRLPASPNLQDRPMVAGARILDGKDEADALITRLRRLQVEQMEKYYRQIPGDVESSDEDSGGDRKA